MPNFITLSIMSVMFIYLPYYVGLLLFTGVENANKKITSKTLFFSVMIMVIIFSNAWNRGHRIHSQNNIENNYEQR